MKELLRTTDPTVIAFAQALLQGEGITAFAMDVHMSILEGGIGTYGTTYPVPPGPVRRRLGRLVGRGRVLPYPFPFRPTNESTTSRR
ncbi:DUF2007 domain-containing protein [Falsirhodobacter sp. alg1]|uniref:putative signal transducing protein n=1 Tax=Falsirhodobacter sp. alg1 TaxID=1472418 RepID=UPI0009E84949